MIQPLQPGDLVDIVAPASRCDWEDVQKGCELLKQWGLKVRFPKNIFGKHFLLAQSDEMRLLHLKNAILDHESKAIWCVRGGYGSMRLLPELKKIKRPQPKIFIGMSDITSLNLFFNHHWKWPAYHATMLASLSKSPPSIQSELRRFLLGKISEVDFHSIKPMNPQARKKKIIHAPILGGNLMTLQSSLGTGLGASFANGILFFEEVGERGYRVDRMLCHLEQNHIFKQVKAVVIGQMIGGLESNGRNVWKPVLKAFAERASCPVFSNLPCGHGKSQKLLPLGTSARLICGEQPVLKVQTGVRG